MHIRLPEYQGLLIREQHKPHSHILPCSYADSVPFGGYKQSGLGRNKGEYALENYTQVSCSFGFGLLWCRLRLTDAGADLDTCSP